MEGIPSQSKKKTPESVVRVASAREGVPLLRDVQTHLAERMHASGHAFVIEDHNESFSLRADAENFAPLLSNLEELIAEANTDNGTHRLTLVVRGMHAVDVMLAN